MELAQRRLIRPAPHLLRRRRRLRGRAVGHVAPQPRGSHRHSHVSHEVKLLEALQRSRRDKMSEIVVLAHVLPDLNVPSNDAIFPPPQLPLAHSKTVVAHGIILDDEKGFETALDLWRKHNPDTEMKIPSHYLFLNKQRIWMKFSRTTHIILKNGNIWITGSDKKLVDIMIWVVGNGAEDGVDLKGKKDYDLWNGKVKALVSGTMDHAAQALRAFELEIAALGEDVNLNTVCEKVVDQMTAEQREYWSCDIVLLELSNTGPTGIIKMRFSGKNPVISHPKPPYALGSGSEAAINYVRGKKRPKTVIQAENLAYAAILTATMKDDDTGEACIIHTSTRRGWQTRTRPIGDSENQADKRFMQGELNRLNKMLQAR